MDDITVIQVQETRPSLEALRSVPGRVLLLGPGQTLKPGARARLPAAAAADAWWWVPASPHPDLVLSSHGFWLVGAARPPFGRGRPQDATACGILGDGPALADALAAALVELPVECDWQPALMVELGRRGRRIEIADEALIFQQTLPSLDQCLDLERRRGLTFAHLHRTGFSPMGVPKPATVGEVPEEWAKAAAVLAQVPLRTLRNVKLVDQGAPDLLGQLAKAVMERAFELAFCGGWYSHVPAPAAAAVGRPLRRLAVVYPAYGGSLNLARRCAEAAEHLGFEVVRVDPSRHQDLVRKTIRKGGMTVELYRTIEAECVAQIRETRPQMLWILAQAFLSPDALGALRKQGMLSAFWFCEDYRVSQWKESALSVDAFFPMQGGPFVGALRAAGVAVLPPLPACAAAEACRLAVPLEAARALSFFGYPYKNRLRVFEALTDFPLELFGDRWDELASPFLKPLVKDSSLLNEAQGFELFRGSAVNLNLHSSPFLDGIDPEGDYVNPRTFEIAACEGFQICDRRRDLPAAFTEGTEIVGYSSVAELREELGRWMGDSRGRRTFAEAARRRVLAEHTYEHRLKTALKALGISTGA